MISSGRPPSLRSSSKSVQGSRIDPMIASYDDVYGGFSDDQDEQELKHPFRRNGTVKPGENGANMKSSNGILVYPHQHSSNETEPKLKLKPRSASNQGATIENESLKIVQDRQRKLVAVVPPKPPQNFSMFQTLPNRKPAITAPKPNLTTSNSFSTVTKGIFDSKSAGFAPIKQASTDNEPNGDCIAADVKGKVKAMRQVFSTISNPVRNRPPIPAAKDYVTDSRTTASRHCPPVQREEPNGATLGRPPRPVSMKVGPSGRNGTTEPLPKALSVLMVKTPLVARISAPSQAPPAEKTQANGAGGKNKLEKGESGEKGLLDDFVWFHCDLSRAEAEMRLLRFNEDGTFLIRHKSTPTQESPYSLSVLQKGKVYHLQIRQKSNGVYALGDCKENEMEFANLYEIVSYHRRHPLQLIRRKSGELASLALLTTALPRTTP